MTNDDANSTLAAALKAAEDLQRRIRRDPGSAVALTREWQKELPKDVAHYALGIAGVVDAIKGPLVILVHGIRTHAEWQGLVRNQLESANQDVRVTPIQYGWFDAVRFAFPFLTRKGAITRTEQKVRAAVRQYPGMDVCIVAHSFGTYIVTEIIRRSQNDIPCMRLLLCGSVVKENFRWEHVASCPAVVNDCGVKDFLPVLAKRLTWGFGASGRYGFGTGFVRDRYHDTDHSGFFRSEFVEEYWLPWILEQECIQSDFELQMPAAPYWLAILELLPVRWLILGLLLYAAATITCCLFGIPSAQLNPLNWF